MKDQLMCCQDEDEISSIIKKGVIVEFSKNSNMEKNLLNLSNSVKVTSSMLSKISAFYPQTPVENLQLPSMIVEEVNKVKSSQNNSLFNRRSTYGLSYYVSSPLIKASSEKKELNMDENIQQKYNNIKSQQTHQIISQPINGQEQEQPFAQTFNHENTENSISSKQKKEKKSPLKTRIIDLTPSPTSHSKVRIQQQSQKQLISPFRLINSLPDPQRNKTVSFPAQQYQIQSKHINKLPYAHLADLTSQYQPFESNTKGQRNSFGAKYGVVSLNQNQQQVSPKLSDIDPSEEKLSIKCEPTLISGNTSYRFIEPNLQKLESRSLKTTQDICSNSNLNNDGIDTQLNKINFQINNFQNKNIDQIQEHNNNNSRQPEQQIENSRSKSPRKRYVDSEHAKSINISSSTSTFFQKIINIFKSKDKSTSENLQPQAISTEQSEQPKFSRNKSYDMNSIACPLSSQLEFENCNNLIRMNLQTEGSLPSKFSGVNYRRQQCSSDIDIDTYELSKESWNQTIPGSIDNQVRDAPQIQQAITSRETLSQRGSTTNNLRVIQGSQSVQSFQSDKSQMLFKQFLFTNESRPNQISNQVVKKNGDMGIETDSSEILQPLTNHSSTISAIPNSFNGLSPQQITQKKQSASKAQVYLNSEKKRYFHSKNPSELSRYSKNESIDISEPQKGGTVNLESHNQLNTRRLTNTTTTTPFSDYSLDTTALKQNTQGSVSSVITSSSNISKVIGQKTPGLTTFTPSKVSRMLHHPSNSHQTSTPHVQTIKKIKGRIEERTFTKKSDILQASSKRSYQQQHSSPPFQSFSHLTNPSQSAKFGTATSEANINPTPTNNPHLTSSCNLKMYPNYMHKISTDLYLEEKQFIKNKGNAPTLSNNHYNYNNHNNNTKNNSNNSNSNNTATPPYQIGSQKQSPHPKLVPHAEKHIFKHF